MTKTPTPTEMSKGQDDNTNNATKKFDYTAVADTQFMYYIRNERVIKLAHVIYRKPYK